MQRPTWKRVLLAHSGRAPGSGLQAVPLSDFSDESDAVWRSARAAYALSVDRSQRFMRWRFLRKPGTSYQVWGLHRSAGRTADDGMVAFAVTRKSSWRGRSVTLLMDLVAIPRVRRRDALHAVTGPEVAGRDRLALRLSSQLVGGGGGFPISHLPEVVYPSPSIQLSDASAWNVSFTDVDYL